MLTWPELLGVVTGIVFLLSVGWAMRGFIEKCRQDWAAKRSNTCRPRYDIPGAMAAMKADMEVVEELLKAKSDELVDELVAKDRLAADYWKVVAERGYLRAVLKTILVGLTCSRKLLNPEGMEQLFRAEASEISGLLALHAHSLLRTDLSPAVEIATSIVLRDSFEKLLKAGRRLGSKDLAEAVFLAQCLQPQGLLASPAKAPPSSQDIKDILVQAVRRDQSKQE